MTEPSPYVTIKMSRKHAEEVRKTVLWSVTGRAKSNVLWAALKRIDEGLVENAGMSASERSGAPDA